MTQKIALVCGAHRLPFLVRDALRAHGYDVYVIGLRGFYDEKLNPDMVIRLGGGGTAARECKKRGITDVAFVGAIGHPNLSDIRPDLWSAMIVARVVAHSRGYDSMARAFIDVIEARGFHIVGAQTLCPELTLTAGTPTRIKPAAADKKIIARACEVSHTLGALDIGSSVVVDRGVLAIEAAEGTADMLKRVIKIRKKYNATKRSGVFAKMVKPNQDTRIDTTAIGVQTVHDVAAAGLRGIVIDACECFVIDRDAVIAAADRAGIFITAM